MRRRLKQQELRDEYITNRQVMPDGTVTEHSVRAVDDAFVFITMRGGQEVNRRSTQLSPRAAAYWRRWRRPLRCLWLASA